MLINKVIRKTNNKLEKRRIGVHQKHHFFRYFRFRHFSLRYFFSSTFFHSTKLRHTVRSSLVRLSSTRYLKSWFEFGSVRDLFKKTDSGSVRFDSYFKNPVRVRFGSTPISKNRFEFGSISGSDIIPRSYSPSVVFVFFKSELCQTK